jgi:hypothetical protein
MICMKCNQDLAACPCPDLKERFEKILQSEHLYVGPDYQERIRQQIERNEAERSKAE